MDPRFVPDRAATQRDGGRDPIGRPGGGGGPEPVLPSRLGAMAECRQALGKGRGPVLLTGEAGSGKTWAWRRLATERPGLGPGPGSWRWLGLDATPSDDGVDLVRRALRNLGRADSGSLPDPRSALAEELREQAEDGRRWVLVLDEAQNATDAALEEFRLLSNRLGRPDGFAGLLLVGRTELAMRLRARAWESLESRLAAGVRLGPIDAEEAGTLICWAAPGRRWERPTVEELHARSMGNPTRLIRLADRVDAPRVESGPAPSPSTPTPAVPAPAPAAPRRRPSGEARAPEVARRVDPDAGPAAPGRSGLARIEPASATPPAPRLVEARPPLRFEDGLIEVGWSEADLDLDADAEAEAGFEGEQDADDEAGADDDTDADDGAGADALPSSAVAWPSGGLLEPDEAEAPASRATTDLPRGPITEAIDDPYASIQARLEWEIARGAAGSDPAPPRPAPVPGAGPAEAGGRRGPSRPFVGEREEADRRPTLSPSPSQVRAEAGQEFAPYGRLFSQLGSPSDAD
ncbi:ATP-binding protein [Tautonia plasticadhaerens]|uniref:ORC1/DEAH AAA+ ATPase domain-containing protein n=1 Tax=Tautonia plasticadhaerens TaxID=2527974 RepID=A0A518H2U3_9BACT|nr:ATP-binding protein [Tautonia plasticadhaerens]QDV35155.1 hypothetical protein ElP_30580 [Tautonia plasticadhaerens]